MSVFYIADQELVKYVKNIGFKHRFVHGTDRYFVNSLGYQVRISFEEKMIALLNNFGNIVDFSDAFTNRQLDKFAIKGAI